LALFTITTSLNSPPGGDREEEEPGVPTSKDRDWEDEDPSRFMAVRSAHDNCWCKLGVLPLFILPTESRFVADKDRGRKDPGDVRSKYPNPASYCCFCWWTLSDARLSRGLMKELLPTPPLILPTRLPKLLLPSDSPGESTKSWSRFGCTRFIVWCVRIIAPSSLDNVTAGVVEAEEDDASTRSSSKGWTRLGSPSYSSVRRLARLLFLEARSASTIWIDKFLMLLLPAELFGLFSVTTESPLLLLVTQEDSPIVAEGAED
jgi:hypothetical protein